MAPRTQNPEEIFETLRSALGHISQESLQEDVASLGRAVTRFERFETSIKHGKYSKVLKSIRDKKAIDTLVDFWKNTRASHFRAVTTGLKVASDGALTHNLDWLLTATEITLEVLLDLYVKAEDGDSKGQLRQDQTTAQEYLEKAKAATKSYLPSLPAFYKKQAERYGASEAELSAITLPGQATRSGVKRRRDYSPSKPAKVVVLTDKNDVPVATPAITASPPEPPSQTSIAGRRRAGKQDNKPEPSPLTTNISTNSDVSTSGDDSSQEIAFQAVWTELEDLCNNHQEPKRDIQVQMLALVKRLQPLAEAYYQRVMQSPVGPRLISPTVMKQRFPELEPLLKNQTDIDETIAGVDVELQKLKLPANKKGEGKVAKQRRLEEIKLATEKLDIKMKEAIKEKEVIEGNIALIMGVAASEVTPEEPEEPEDPTLGFPDDTGALLAVFELRTLRDMLEAMLVVGDERVRMGYHEHPLMHAFC